MRLKIVLTLGFLSLAACVEPVTTSTPSKSVDQLNDELKTLAGRAFPSCIEHAAYGTPPPSAAMEKLGFSQRRVLGVNVMVRSPSGSNSLFDDRWVSFSYQKRENACLFTATNLGGGLWVTAGFVRTQLKQQGWKHVANKTKSKFVYAKGEKEIVMSGQSTGGQTQFTLKLQN